MDQRTGGDGEPMIASTIISPRIIGMPNAQWLDWRRPKRPPTIASKDTA